MRRLPTAPPAAAWVMFGQVGLRADERQVPDASPSRVQTQWLRKTADTSRSPTVTGSNTVAGAAPE